MSNLDYGRVRCGKLTLKGEKITKIKKKTRESKKRSGDKRDVKNQNKIAKIEMNADIASHGGWWPISSFNQISGTIAIQFHDGLYVKAHDDGSFGLGVPHKDGEGPDPEEILLAIRLSDNKIALKSGYDKYLRVEDQDQAVRGISDAVGLKEQWEPVFQEGRLALQGPNNCFLTANSSDEIICSKSKAEKTEMLILRSNAEREEDRKALLPSEEQGSVGQIELNYVKKYQKFQNHKIKLNSSNREELIKARDEGHLHETLLNRRSKMKADRYCK